MYHFYTEKSNISDDYITIYGEDVNHIKNVLRMSVGEELIICDGEGVDYHCSIDGFDKECVKARILGNGISEAELPFRIWLFQGLPKKDKMELIIQKNVELGVYKIVPVMTRRVIVKLDDKKKEERKLERWQAISESASKQSGRGLIPEICPVMSFPDALKTLSELDCAVIPYENADSSEDGIKNTRAIIEGFKDKKNIGIFIGPEGGFDPEEVEKAMQAGITPVTLGKRILRTETAGMMVLSAAGFLSV